MEIRHAEEGELDRLARLWNECWHEAHAHLVPLELTQLRTLESFRSRLAALLPDIRVAGSPDDPVGFCIVKDDELYQLFVSPHAKGSMPCFNQKVSIAD